MSSNKRHPIRALGLAAALLCGILGLTVPAAHAQALAADAYEPNDTPVTARAIPNAVSLPDLTIFPAGEADCFRLLAVPGLLSVTAFATPGLDLELTVLDNSGNAITTANDPASPDASVTLTVPATGYVILRVTSATLLEGFYRLDVFNAAPTATPTFQPTPTSPFPTPTPTPDRGGPPDYAEPNYSFATAYRIAPGTRLTGLNFNSGVDGQPDNDFFVMAVRAGVRYTCRTEDLAPTLDTNLIVYYSPDFADIAGGNDDVDTQAGAINSAVTFSARAEGDVYILAGYKYPATEDLRTPGAATYTLRCEANQPTPTPAAGPAGASLLATPLSVQVLQEPGRTPAPTARPVLLLVVDVLVAYDRNANQQAEPAEGVAGLSVRVVEAATNHELAQGLTDLSGAVRLVVATGQAVRVTIPFLAAAQEFRPGSPAQWTLLIPAASLPALIP